ncbi:MAG: secondary thiamine-phosphate synthase enzyme YjbQ [Pseudomonadota bacterium]
MRVHTTIEANVRRVVTGSLAVETRGGAFHDITGPVVRWLREIEAGEGVTTAFVRHTTASLVVQENADPEVQDDLIDALSSLAPETVPYRHGEEGLDDMPGHIKAMICGPSVTLPCSGSPRFGTWQSVYLVEHRAHSRRREVLLTYLGS